MAEQRGSARPAEGDERLSALMTNANAIRAVAASVEGTLGPRGLNCMLVAPSGEVTITNDGSTILSQIEASHPAARLLIHAAQAQEREVGDGTTTAAVLAGALVAAAVGHIARGVPVARLIEGMRAGIERALAVIEALARPLAGLDDPLLHQAALVAGRAHADIAALVVEAARVAGEAALRSPSFRLTDRVTAREGDESRVLRGVVLRKTRLNRQMPHCLEDVRLLAVDDSLEPEPLGDEALATEAGFRRFVQLQEEFRAGLRTVIEAGVRCVLVERAVDPVAEEMLTDAGAIVVRRVAAADLSAVAAHCGARLVKRTVLRRAPAALEAVLGRAGRVQADDRRECLAITEGAGEAAVTLVVGAATCEVRAERERIARDAAAAVQAVVRGGAVPGGGASEIAAARAVQALRPSLNGMAAYGADVVAEALRTPLMRIVANAGYNPLEKVEEVVAAQASGDCPSLAVDCETGAIREMLAAGIVDPLPVKRHALRTAFEVAEAILRIDTIIKRRLEIAPPGET